MSATAMRARCPQCDSRDDVEYSGLRDPQWWCTTCNLAFTGSSHERAAMTERRQEHADKKAGKAPTGPKQPALPLSHHAQETPAPASTHQTTAGGRKETPAT